MTSPEDAVGRCQALIVRALTEDHGERVVEEFVAEISRVPAGHPERGRLAGALIMVLDQGDSRLAISYLRHLATLVSIADTNPPTTQRWPALRTAAHGRAVLYGGVTGEVHDPDAIKDHVAKLVQFVGDHPKSETFGQLGELATDFVHAMGEGNLSELNRASAAIPALVEELLGDGPEASVLKDQMTAIGQLVAANQRADEATMRDSINRLAETAKSLPEGHVLREVMRDGLRQTDALWTMIDTESAGLTDDQVAELVASANRPDATPAQRVLDHLALGGSHIGGGLGADPERIERGIASYRTALSLTAPGDQYHAFCQYSLGMGLYMWSEAAGSSEGLDEAVSLLESARDQLGGPRHPQWTTVTDLLANVRQRTGRSRESGELGLLAQRGYTWRVLREANATGARNAVRDAAGSAINVARQCLQVNNVTDALRALDTGRGLMLFAATELPRVPAKLRAAGREDLARRWSADNGATAEVRREALTVIAGQPGADDLFDPPSLAEIRAALAALDADALVYLVPAERPGPGLAVIAPVDGPPAWLPLPDLAVAGDAEVERYLTVLVDRSRDLAPTEDAPLTDSLAELCGWAWRVAVGPLLERYFLTEERRRADGREPRIVLVPMGDLARIPWQAARRGDGTHAVELAEFSHAVSARMLCENAAQDPVAPSATGLIVGDPDTAGRASPLIAARTEAHALRRGFYQGARYVGRRPNESVSPSGAGTAAQVRQWLTDPRPAAGGMLHLACHGCYEVEGTDTRAYLLLAPEEDGAEASTLSAEEIVVLLADAELRRIGLVVLAACHSARSVHGYDEAYSLGTAFLAGRARSVLSTQWSIPDEETSALMYMFHHHRFVDGLPARQALRLAQRWLLDPNRRAPAGMPAQLLASVPERAQAPVYAWAGFVHYGQ